MSHSSTWDVLIVGGGPAGASTATWCARAGLKVLVVDRALFPRDKACAEYLSPEAGRDLEALGILAAVEAGAMHLGGFRLVADNGASAMGRYEGARQFAPFRPYGLAMARTAFDVHVQDGARLAGAEIRQGVAFEALAREGHTVTGAVLREGARQWTERASLVVGADGLHSRVARALGVARAGRPRRLALVAHMADLPWASDVGEMHTARGWYVGLAPIGNGLVNVAAVVPHTDAAAIAGGAEAFLRAKLATLPALRERLAGARVAREVLVTGPFARRARAVVADGALLVGDAADFFDPFTGEGIFAALRGGRLAAHAIGAALASGGPTARTLRPYAAARRRAFAGKWLLERIVGLGATHPAIMRRFVARLARRPTLADLWVGAAGDIVPVGSLFSPRHLAALLG